MADLLLTTPVHLNALATWLDSLLPTGVPVVVDEPPSNGPTPFVVLSGVITPLRFNLAGNWGLADLEVVAESVHDTKVQAQALAALVRTAFLTGTLPLAGALELDLGSPAFLDDPAGVPQVRESWVIHLQRT